MNARQSITSTFFKGLAVLLPISILIGTLYWVGSWTEAVLKTVFQPILPPGLYLPGMGFLLGLLLCYFVGLLMSTSFATRVGHAWRRTLEHLPLIKSLYGAVEDIISSFSRDKKRFNRVVKIRFPASDYWLVGFVTREDLSELPAGLNSADEIAVYLPMSYQIGGYVVFLPKTQVEPLDLSVEDASRLVLTAGMSIHKIIKPH